MFFASKLWDAGDADRGTIISTRVSREYPDTTIVVNRATHARAIGTYSCRTIVLTKFSTYGTKFYRFTFSNREL